MFRFRTRIVFAFSVLTVAVFGTGAWPETVTWDFTGTVESAYNNLEGAFVGFVSFQSSTIDSLPDDFNNDVYIDSISALQITLSNGDVVSYNPAFDDQNIIYTLTGQDSVLFRTEDLVPDFSVLDDGDLANTFLSINFDFGSLPDETLPLVPPSDFESGQIDFFQGFWYQDFGLATLDGIGTIDSVSLRPAVVPLPPAVGLGLMGLGFIGWVRRRKRQAP